MRKLGNLTLILGSYKCDKSCPFCIAKNNHKFSMMDDNIYKIEEILHNMKKLNIHFERFVISGNGEPSLYDVKFLKHIKNILMKYIELFDGVRIHTSGHIFFEDEIELKPEFEILRLSLLSSLDMLVLKYKRNYLLTENFNKALKIKMDMGLTDYFNYDKFEDTLLSFLIKYKNIETIRLKKLMNGDNIMSSQGEWVLKHNISEKQKNELIDKLNKLNNTLRKNNVTSKIIYDIAGNYENDLVISNGRLLDYSNNVIKKKMLLKRCDINE